MKPMWPRLFVLALCLPAVARAHDSAAGGGFLPGFVHPILGFDHLLAMLSVGILSAQKGGRAIWSVPAIFVGCMLAGGIAGLRHMGLPRVELGIAISVLALGLVIAAARKLSMPWAMLGVGFFGFLHGQAHGGEIPAVLDPFTYVLGFLCGTAGIHLGGVGIGWALTREEEGARLLRILGSGMAGCGLFFAAQALNGSASLR